jgi:NAD(P)-dependent dehydrogenase (short-subunit alcohol dehydrogenase family)
MFIGPPIPSGRATLLLLRSRPSFPYSTKDGDVEQQRQRSINSIPLGRFGTSGDVAKAVVFVACDDSSFVAGAELSVDGGFAQV